METSGVRRLWLVGIALILTQAVLGYYVSKLYTDKQALSEQVAGLNTQVSDLTGQLTAVGGRVTSAEQKLVALPQPPTADEVAKAVVADVKVAVAEDIAGAVAKTLVDTPRFKNRLKGEKGEAGQNGPTLDEVAQKVYETYHDELRGKDGANGVSPDPAEVAKIMAADLQFADIVGQLKDH